MRSLTLLPAAALCAALALPAAAAAAPRRFDLDGTLTQTNVIVTRCPGLGGTGMETTTVTWETETTASGAGLVPTGGGQIKVRTRQRNRTVKTIEGNESLRPVTLEVPWSRLGEKDVPFGAVVEAKRGKLVIDANELVAKAGARASRMPARRGASVSPDFRIAPVEHKMRNRTCAETQTVSLEGSLKATRLN